MIVTSRDIFGFIALYLSSSLSSAAGVGGGSVNVAIFYILIGYSFHQSVIFSLSTLFGNYTLQVFINWNKRHPLISSRPMIYWNVILLLLPAQLGGADLGVILGYVFPETLLIIFAMIVLLLTSTVTLIKGLALHDKETALLQKEEMERNGQASHDVLSPLHHRNRSNMNDDNGSKVVMPTTENPEEQVETASLLNYDEYEDNNNNNRQSNDSIPRRAIPTVSSASMLADGIAAEFGMETETIPTEPLKVPWIPILVVFISWMIYALFYVLMNDVTVCSIPYFIFFALVYPILIIEITWGYFYIKSLQEIQILSYNQSQGLEYDNTNRNHPNPMTYQSIHSSSEDENEIRDYLNDQLTNRSKSMSYRNPEVEDTNILLESVRIATSDPSAGHFPIVKGDIRWGESIFTPVIVIFLAFCIGVISALLGIGGGELMGPLLLRLKVLPQVSSATVPVMSLLNTSSSIIHYMTIDDFSYEYSIVMFVIGALGGYTGRSIAIRLTSILKRPSILVFFLVSILMLSVILFAYELSVETANFNFGTFC